MTRRRSRPRHRRPFPIDGLTLEVDDETGHVTEIRRDDPTTGESQTLATADRDTGMVETVDVHWARAMRESRPRTNHHPL